MDGFAYLLPYLEQQALYDQYRWDLDAGGVSEHEGARTVQLKLLQCPSADSDRTLEWQNPQNGEWFRDNACTDYAAVRTVDPELAKRGLINPAGNYEGVLGINFMTRVADIMDGTSQTILVAEDAGRPATWQGGQRRGQRFAARGSKGAVARSRSAARRHPSIRGRGPVLSTALTTGRSTASIPVAPTVCSQMAPCVF